MNDLEQRILELRQHLNQEEDTENLLATLRDIEALVKEHPVEDSYDLLANVYLALYRATSDNANLARDLILERFLPWLISPDQPESADNARGHSRDTLREWLNQYPENERQTLLEMTLDVLAKALLIQPTVALCWTISSLAYRRSDLVTGLWKVIQRDDDVLGDIALRALARLGIQGSDRQFLLDELHRRVTSRLTIPLLAALGDLTDVSTIPIMHQCLNHLSSDNEIPFGRTLGLGVLSKIADTHHSNDAVQEAVWSTTVELYESATDRYTSDIYLNNETAPYCNDPRVPLHLVKWLEYHSENTEGAIYRRYLLYLRLSECVRPRQLTGFIQHSSPKALALIRRDSRRNSQNTSRWSTQESYAKEQAWDTLLCLGSPSVLSSTQFDKSVSQEASGYLRGEIMELLACFSWRQLPEQVITWITERVDLQQDTASQELPFRRGAEHLGRSAATRQAFEALLAFGMTFHGDTLRETADALSSVSIRLVQRGEPGVIEALLETMEHGEEERHRTVAMQALAWIASNDLFPPQHLPRVLTALRDEKRNDFERSRLVHILGFVPHMDMTSDTLGILERLARSGQTQTATSALEALAQNGALLKMPDLLERQLHLHIVGKQWDYQPSPTTGHWIVGMICTVYSHDPKLFAPAVATLLENLGVFELPILLWTLDDIYRAENQHLPTEVRDAFILRLERLQDEVLTTPTELFQICANLLPDALAEKAWEDQWEAWIPETRAALAQALGQSTYTTESAKERAIKHLLLLVHDAQYKVRRSANRSLATIAPDVLYRVGLAWAYAPVMELRRRAAEALNWLSPSEKFWQVAGDVLSVLAVDPDPLVREALVYASTERRQRLWANDYLAQVRSVYGKSNKIRLGVWRYAHALTITGDDTAITELQADLTTRKLAPYERQWVLWILNNTRENWKKTVDKWPKPWFRWTGSIVYERGQISLADNSVLNGTFCIYQQVSSTEAIQDSHWDGSFWPDTSTPVSGRETLELILNDKRRGNAIVVDHVGEEVWVLEGIGSLE